MRFEEVVLIDENDMPIGTMEKLQAHREARLHRAFSVIILNDKGEMLIHKRALVKYHSGGVWTNACCGHPRPNEATQAAAERRLQEEMGFTVPLQKVYHFTYKATLGNSLTEHELDHVFVGYYNEAPQPNPDEVCDWKYLPISEIQTELQKAPEHFSVWFQLIMKTLPNYLTTPQFS